MKAMIIRTQITPITMPAMAPRDSPDRVWDEGLEVGVPAVGETGLMVDEEVECAEEVGSTEV